VDTSRSGSGSWWRRMALCLLRKRVPQLQLSSLQTTRNGKHAKNSERTTTKLPLQFGGVMAAVSTTTTTGSKLGFWGHSKLLLISTVLVLIVQISIKTINDMNGNNNNDNIAEKEESKAATTDGFSSGGGGLHGMMDRCPWPFIISHDPVQFMKDPPTWIVLTWFALWRMVKLTSKVPVP